MRCRATALGSGGGVREVGPRRSAARLGWTRVITGVVPSFPSPPEESLISKISKGQISKRQSPIFADNSGVTSLRDSHLFVLTTRFLRGQSPICADNSGVTGQSVILPRVVYGRRTRSRPSGNITWAGEGGRCRPAAPANPDRPSGQNRAGSSPENGAGLSIRADQPSWPDPLTVLGVSFDTTSMARANALSICDVRGPDQGSCLQVLARSLA